MEEQLWIIPVLVFLVGCSAFFSASETAFSSLSRTRLKVMAQAGDKGARRALALSEDYDRLLSSVLIGNNIVNILATSLATVFFVELSAEYGVTLSTAVMTIVVLIFGEVSPKSLAKQNPERIAIFATSALLMILKVLTPFVFLFEQWKKLLGKIFRFDKSGGITEDELMILVDEAETDGGIDQNDGELIRAVIEFNDLDAEDILTHRMDISAVEDTASAAEIAAVFAETGFSRLPVFHDTIDTIVGIINEKDFFAAKDNDPFVLRDVMKKPICITEGTKISQLLKQLQGRKMHMAIVVDEFGGTAGIVTLEDVLEELVGDIWDEHDDVIEEITKVAEHTYVIHCSTSLSELLDRFGISEEYDTVTVGGWVMQMLGKVPEVGDRFVYENMEVLVTETDNRRPVEIRVVTSEESSPQSGEGA